MNTIRLGKYGEITAASWLEDCGYTILETNWRCRYGEIDLIASHNENIVFIEVKTRSNTQFGNPFESITPKKAARLRRLAVMWCQEHKPVCRDIRIDAVGIVCKNNTDVRIEHRQGVA